MKDILYILIVVATLASCTSNKSEEQMPQEQSVPVSIKFGTRASGTFETDINRVRVVMFRASDGRFMSNNYFDPVSLNKITFNSYTGTYDIYYIINEPLSAGGAPMADFSSTNSIAKVNALKLAYSTPSSSPYEPDDIPMFKVVNSQVIGVTNSLSVTVERTMAKVYVDAVVDRNDFPAGGYIEVQSITIKSLPRYCYVVAAPYDGTTYANSETQTVTSTSIATEDTYKSVFYIPEYLLVGGATENAVIEIVGKIKNLGLECKWIEPLGDKMDKNPAHTKYDIRRNTEYQLIARIKGYGQHELFMTTRIEDWVNKGIDETLN